MMPGRRFTMGLQPPQRGPRLVKSQSDPWRPEEEKHQAEQRGRQAEG